MAGDEVDILRPDAPPIKARLENLFNADWEPIAAAPHAEMLVYWQTGLEVPAGSFLRRAT